MQEKDLIEQCLKGVSLAQSLFYKRFSSLVYGISLRYAKNAMEAEDSVQETFVKIFRYLKDYQGAGSLEGWVRRIAVNTAITNYRKSLKGKFDAQIEDQFHLSDQTFDQMSAEYTMEEMLACIQALPDGYRTVFNLYVIEGYKHKEIAEMLGIDANTSKSQLSRAKTHLQNALLSKSRQGLKPEENYGEYVQSVG
ncbi:MAG: RNA polymerase sigma factor [Bacteroidota bacterium]